MNLNQRKLKKARNCPKTTDSISARTSRYKKKPETKGMSYWKDYVIRSRGVCKYQDDSYSVPIPLQIS